MVQVRAARGRGAKYAHLRENATIGRWYRNLARGSEITANVYLRRLGNVCEARKVGPEDLIGMTRDARRDFLTDFVSAMEDAGLTGGYIESTLKALRSWLSFNNVAWELKIKVKGAQATPSLDNERVPTQEELRRIFLAASPRERVAAALLAHAGLRIETLGNYRGTDGLRLGDLPDVVAKGKTLTFRKIPLQAVVRPELSKSDRRYFTFLGPEPASYLKAYLEGRLRDGEKLTDESDVIAPTWSKKAFLTSINVGDIRKLRDDWCIATEPDVDGFGLTPKHLLTSFFSTVRNETPRFIRHLFLGPHGTTPVTTLTMTHSSPPEPSRSLAEPKLYRIKVCLIGEQGVGKTSLVHRFVSGSFDESYIRSLGMRVSKKTVTLDRPSSSVHADLMVSDIMGNRTFLNLFKEAYFEATQGVLAVFDVTRRDTLLALEAWISALLDRVGLVPVLTLGNKIDIPGRRETSDAEVAEVLRRYDCPVQYTSAKTGENVEEAFRGLAEAILGGGGGL